MVNTIFIFFVALFMVIKGSTMATTYASKLASSFCLSKYTVGFIVVAIISILPETFISINAALDGIPSFGLGVLFGSNIADLTLVFAILIFYARRSLRVETSILRHHIVYPLILAFPLILGFDGYFSRAEGLLLIVAGGIFYYITLKNGTRDKDAPRIDKGRYKNLFLLLTSMAILLVGAHFTVTQATILASSLGVSPVLVGILIVGLGTTMPELFFSLRSLKKRDDSLALGDLLGTVLADATIVVGIIAIVHPFAFPITMIYVTGAFMVLASLILFRFMRSGRALTEREGFILLVVWIAFVITELIVSK